ncbi:MAG: ABC transporter permease [Candidatus Binatia bacterium]
MAEGNSTFLETESKKSRKREQLRLGLYRLAFGLAVLTVWQLSASPHSFLAQGLPNLFPLIDDYWVSTPSKIAEQFWEITRSGEIFIHFKGTMLNTVIGYVFGAAIGISIGFLLAEFETIAKVLEPYIMAFNGVPRIAYAPLFIVWFGIDIESKVILVMTIVFFLTFINTYSGIRGVNPDLINIARIMGATKLQIMRKVVLPGASPWIISGLKVSVPFSLVGAIVGEFIAASSGLGFLLQLYMNLYNTTGVILVILILMFVVMILNILLNWMESYVLRWRPTTSGTQEGPEM